jgi:Dirigent-like protein
MLRTVPPEGKERSMRRFGAVVVVVLTTLVLLAASPASSQREPQVIRVLSVGEEFYTIEGQADRPPQVGDRFSFEGSFYAWAGHKRGNRVGRFQVLITVITPRWGHLTATGTLPGGTLVIAGRTPLFDVPLEQYSVIGGTGRYAGARGTLTLKDIRGPGDKSALTFRLLR